MPTIINQSTESVPTPDGALDPYEVGEVPRRWFLHHQSHRLKTPEEYNAMIRGLDRKALIDHTKVRRDCTDEDLDAQAKTEELREQLFLEEPAGEVAAE